MTKIYNLDGIMEKTKREGECIIWQGGIHNQGYGMIRQNGEMRTVHSVVAELKYGRRPSKTSGERVTRTCDNLLCCNPDHIVIKSTDDIIFDGNRRFTDDEVRQIRAEVAADKSWGSKTRISKKWNMHINTLKKITNGTSYGWVK